MIKIDVITGFLGSGKTTWIQKLIEAQVFEQEKLVIIENEFGEVPIDQIVLESRDYTLIELSKGCLCCSLRGELITTLDSIRQTIQPTRILIEPSGIFILEDLFDVLKTPMIKDYYQLHQIITIVDSKLLKMNQLRYTQFFSSQIRFANHLVLSKLDIYGEDIIDEAIEELRKINPIAIIHALNKELWTKEFLMEVFNQDESYSIHQLEIQSDVTNHASIESYGIEGVRSFSSAAFEKLLVAIKSEQFGYIIRLKGFINIEGSVYLLNYYQGEHQLEPSSLKIPSRLAIVGEHLRRSELKRRLSGYKLART
jgi:G3E family GTPase